MSIVIKGMDKPKTCFNCPCKMYDEVDSVYCAAIDGEPYIDDEDNGVLPDCPISALPQKHGRLIDADVVYANIDNLLSGDGAKWLAESAVHDAPTVIEAEDEE